jgi:hypothetical protein
VSPPDMGRARRGRQAPESQTGVSTCIKRSADTCQVAASGRWLP